MLQALALLGILAAPQDCEPDPFVTGEEWAALQGLARIVAENEDPAAREALLAGDRPAFPAIVNELTTAWALSRSFRRTATARHP